MPTPDEGLWIAAAAAAAAEEWAQGDAAAIRGKCVGKATAGGLVLVGEECAQQGLSCLFF